MNTSDLRRSIYCLLTAVALAIAAAKVFGVENVWEPSRYAAPTADGFNANRIDAPSKAWPATRPEPTPMFGSNDRSRWATVRALVDHGTFIIGERVPAKTAEGYLDRGIVFEDGWQSIDRVKDPATDKFYSSKPPLFALLVAAEYWVLKHVFGLEIVRDRWPVVIIGLLTFNVIPFAISLVLLARLIEQHGRTDFGRLLAFTAACFGTFLITFSNTLNNHTPAACCVVFALYPLLRKRSPQPDCRQDASVDAPEMSRQQVDIQSPSSIKAYLCSGFFAGLAATFDLPAMAFTASLFLFVLHFQRNRAVVFMLGVALPVMAWLAANYAALGQLRPAYSEFGGPWYDYPGSHWIKLRLAQNGTHVPGIDFAQESRVIYLLHCLLGHHGWFSLTPIWLVGILGCWTTVRGSRSDPYRITIQLAWLLTLVLVVFFVFVQRTNNYGGNTSGLRWFFWTTPLWILATLAGADRLARLRWARLACTLLLGLSTLSVFYPAWNPWRSPWLLVMMERLEWVNYDRRQ